MICAPQVMFVITAQQVMFVIKALCPNYYHFTLNCDV